MRSAPQMATAVRSASIGLAVLGSARSAVSTAGETGSHGSFASGFQSPVQRSSATAAYDPPLTSSPMGYPRYSRRPASPSMNEREVSPATTPLSASSRIIA